MIDSIETYKKEHGLPIINEYGMCKDHRKESRDIYNFISEVDFINGDVFCFKKGGDGDNGEMLMDLLDKYFEENSNSVKSQLEVEPVVHGYWVMEERAGVDFWCCSECHKIRSEYYEKPRDNFCPRCGAKMDGKVV